MSRILSALLVLAVAGSAAASGREPVDPCMPDPCDPGCDCLDIDGMAECICPPPKDPCRPDPCDPGCECIDVDGMAECVCPPPPTKAPIEPVTPTDAPVRTPSRY